MNAYLNGWKHYAVFRARSPRFEYWIFTLVNGVIVWLLLGAHEFRVWDALLHHQMLVPSTGAMFLAAVGQFFALALVIPNIAVSVRRLHDTDRSGWWWWLALLPIIGWIVLLVWYSSRGTPGDNRYGPNPQAGNAKSDSLEAKSGPAQ
ncbi:MAG: DUF805 domain-containing protein [Sinobacteraceae bacterium]|nr:DUF805 domain-containing protein [Nevskiaceae bacterium]